MRALHVSKFPPSPSGVGLYADVFSDVLAVRSSARRAVMPASPRASQMLTSAIGGFAGGFRRARQQWDLVHVELSGRALSEFYFTLALLQRRKAQTCVAVTVHDAPSIVGSPTLFTSLDHRGLRRLASIADQHFGLSLERAVVQNCDAVFALTGEGAALISEKFDRAVYVLPHVVPRHMARPWPREGVFVPGYFDGPTTWPVLSALLARLPHPPSLTFGSCSTASEKYIRDRLMGSDVAFAFTGELSEYKMLDVFSRSALVLRWVQDTQPSNTAAASGPLMWALAAGAEVVTNDARAGASELAEHQLIRRVKDLSAGVREAMDALDRPRTSLAEKATSLFGVEAVADAYWPHIPHLRR